MQEHLLEVEKRYHSKIIPTLVTICTYDRFSLDSIAALIDLNIPLQHNILLSVYCVYTLFGNPFLQNKEH